MGWLLTILGLFTALAAILISWIKWSQTFWYRKGVPTLPVTFFFGHAKGTFSQKESVSDLSLRMYRSFKMENKRHGGMYNLTSPTYVPVDLEIVRSIMQTDFDHFVDRGMYYNEESDPLSAHLFSLEGAKWRSLRNKLTPTFTSGKMKMMVETLVKCGEQLIIEMDRNVDKGPFDVKEILGRFTTDVIGNCAFGLECNTLQNPDNEFNRYLKLFFTIDGFKDNLRIFTCFVLPKLAKMLGLKLVKPRLSEFFMRVITETVDYREKNNVYRKDFMHLLLQLKNRGQLFDDESVLGDKGESGVTLTLNELAAQAFVFFLAGYETSSTTMTFCLFELASNPDIQDKLRQEIEGVFAKHSNKLTYDAVMEMHYLEKVINETLRKYPPSPTLKRVCTKDYIIPGTDIVLEKGTPVSIPVLGIQRDPDYYPEPEKFDPERFSEDNKRKRPPFTFLTFGEGPRICIGLRFGMLQTKIGLALLLKNYIFSLNSKTHTPLMFDKRMHMLSVEGGLWLDYAKVS